MERIIEGWKVEFPDGALVYSVAAFIDGARRLHCFYATGEKESISSINEVLGESLDNRSFTEFSGKLPANSAKIGSPASEKSEELMRQYLNESAFVLSVKVNYVTVPSYTQQLTDLIDLAGDAKGKLEYVFENNVRL